MSTSSRPVFPILLTDKTAIKNIRELTRWAGPGFHPDNDLLDYVTDEGVGSYSDEEAEKLNSELAAAASKPEFNGIDPCGIGLPVQRKMIL